MKTTASRCSDTVPRLFKAFYVKVPICIALLTPFRRHSVLLIGMKDSHFEDQRLLSTPTQHSLQFPF